MERAVVFFLVAIEFYFFATVASAECNCDTSLPVFSEDPLVFADEGLVSYVTPNMVWKSVNGECAVDNSDGFYEGEISNFFFFGGEEFGQVQIYTNDYSNWIWATMADLNEWALAICQQLR